MAEVLLVGGAGFIGSNLAVHLLAAGHAVRVFERPGAVSPLPPELRERIAWREGDFTQPASLAPALDGADIVVHLASSTLPQTSNEQPIEDIQTNLIGAVRLMQASRAAKVRRLIFASSGGTIYGRPKAVPIHEDHPTEPVCSYGIVKLAVEKYLALFQAECGLDYVALRLANPYGPYQKPNAAQGAVGVFVGRALAGEPIEIWGDGEVVRDFVHISDVCRAVIAATDTPLTHRVLNVGSGEGHSLNALIGVIEACLGRPVLVTHRPGRSVDVPVNVLDISRIRSGLGWSPITPFAEGVGALIRERQAKP